jgi:CRP-like cAMP-binding protein
MVVDSAANTWPEKVYRAPLLKRLDARGRADLAQAGRLLKLQLGDELFQPGQPADCLYVVVDGSIELRATARGDESPGRARTRSLGDTFGDEAAFAGARRSALAVARSTALIAELPFSIFSRAVVRGGGGELASREIGHMRRQATRDLLVTLSFARELSDDDLELLLDAVSHRRYASGEEVCTAGQPARSSFFLQYGLVQVQREHEGRVSVRAYLSAGDYFGDEALTPGGVYPTQNEKIGANGIM